jgi:hypothetical protein
MPILAASSPLPFPSALSVAFVGAGLSTYLYLLAEVSYQAFTVIRYSFFHLKLPQSSPPFKVPPFLFVTIITFPTSKGRHFTRRHVIHLWA